MSKLDDLCDSLDFAASEVAIPPGVLKLVGEVVKEAKRLQKEWEWRDRKWQISVDDAVKDRLLANDILAAESPSPRTEDTVCMCGQPASKHYCASGAANPMKFFKPRIEKKGESETKPLSKQLHGTAKLEADVAELQERVDNMLQTINGVAGILDEHIDQSPSNEDLENVRGEINEVDRRIDDMEPR